MSLKCLGFNNNTFRKYKSKEIFSWIIKYSQNRTVLPHNLITLNPVTRATKPYNPEQKHKNAFDKLKVLLSTSPVYRNIIDPNLKKILFTDASDKGC